MIKSDVLPDAFRRPGAMPLDVLQPYNQIKGERGT